MAPLLQANANPLLKGALANSWSASSHWIWGRGVSECLEEPVPELHKFFCRSLTHLAGCKGGLGSLHQREE